MHALPSDMLSEQLGTIELLLAMFYNEMTVSNPAALTALRECVETAAAEPEPQPTRQSQLPLAIDLELSIEVALDRCLDLRIRIPLVEEESDGACKDTAEPPRPVYSLPCPSWLTRKSHAELVAKMPVTDRDGVLAVVEYLKDNALAQLNSDPAHDAASNDHSNSQPPLTKPQKEDNIVRVWFYLQSLSTRSKRLDLVNWAPSYSITGFVLAGKPGILCLEGTSADISAYMSEIKTRSWSDVPSHQKKVSERYREEGEDVVRKFEGIREVTGEISKGGKRGNRGEMAEVRALSQSVGLEGLFEVVVGLGGGGGSNG